MTETVHEPGKIPGLKVTFGGQDYIVPPLNIKNLKRFNGQIAKITSDSATPDAEKLTLICEIALAAVQRNYPSTTMDFMEEWVDLGNCWAIFGAIMGQSGYAAAKPGEMQAGA